MRYILLVIIFVMVGCSDPKIVWENDEIKAQNEDNERGYKHCLSLLGQWLLDNPGVIHSDNCTKNHFWVDKEKTYYRQGKGKMCYYPFCEKLDRIPYKYDVRNGKSIEYGTDENGHRRWREVK